MHGVCMRGACMGFACEGLLRDIVVTGFLDVAHSETGIVGQAN